MPLYNFWCEKCGKVEEQIVNSYKIKESICESCGGISFREFPVELNFVLKYDPKKDKVTWGDQNYSKTRRYEQYDQMAKHNIFDQKVKAKSLSFRYCWFIFRCILYSFKFFKALCYFSTCYDRNNCSNKPY